MARLSTRSVRFRVTGLATLIVAVLLTVVAVALVVVQHRSLSAAVDDGLRRRADDVAAAVADGIPPSLAGVEDDTAAQLVTVGGTVLVASANLTPDTPIDSTPTDGTSVVELQLPGPDDAFRVLSRRVDSPQGPMVLHVATAADEISDSVAILRTSLLLAVPLAVAFLAATVWWLVGRALLPVEEMRTEVDSITASDLGRRVLVPNTHDEVERLAATMNGMLDRIESGVSRLERFVADASHELRSPLTRIRSELEVDRANPEQSDFAATHASVLEEALAMQQLVDDLLFLARSDEGRQVSATEPVDLDDLVLAEVERLRARSAKVVDVEGLSAGQVSGDVSQLKRMISNLAINATQYAATTVSFSLEEQGDDVVLTVADDGPGVADTEREQVFERFARTDEGRARDDGGSGLGLAIVRDVVDRHGGSVSIDASYVTGAQFVVRLPRA